MKDIAFSMVGVYDMVGFERVSEGGIICRKQPSPAPPIWELPFQESFPLMGCLLFTAGFSRKLTRS